MASTYVNDLRLNEMATGDQSGSWGTVTNTNLELIAEAFSFGTEGITTNADTHTTTIADGATDPGRSMFLKYTGTLDSACTITIAPNTVSKLWFIENATSGSQNIIIKQGSGATITIPSGDTKAIYSDGAGSGGKMVDAFASLSVVDLNVSGDLDVDGTASLDVVDIDGAVQIDATLSVGVDDTGYDVKFFGATASAYMLWDASADDLILGGAAGLSVNSASVFNGGFAANADSTITIDDNGVALNLISTDTDASQGPILRLTRDVAGAASDIIGTIQYYGQDVAGNNQQYVELQSEIVDATEGSEDSSFIIKTYAAGDIGDKLSILPTEVVFNEGSRDIDFRVESDNRTHALFIQGSDGLVGINQDTPTQALDVGGGGRFVRTTNLSNVILETTDTDADGGPILEFYRNPGQAGVDDDDLGEILFYGLNNASEKTEYAKFITEITDPANGAECGRIGLSVMNNGTLRSVFDSNMDNGEVVINNSSQDIDFRVESDADTHAFFVEGSTGNIGMSISNPDSHTPQTHNPDKLSFVSHAAGGTQFVASRSDTGVTAGDYIGGYLFKTNDSSGNRFGGMIATADDTSGNGNLEFFPVMTTYDSTTTTEGSMQLDDSGDMYIRGGGIRVGRSHGNVYTTAEESVIIYSGGVSNTGVRITGRDGTGGDAVFLYERGGTTKAEIEENGDFLSATDNYGAVSDGRLKENIVDSGSQWDDIKALQIKKYSFIDAELDAPNMIGVIAQDLLAAGMNGLVKQNFKTNADDEPILDADGNHDYIYTVKSSVMQMKALKALQEAMAKIEVLEAKVAALET